MKSGAPNVEGNPACASFDGGRLGERAHPLAQAIGLQCNTVRLLRNTTMMQFERIDRDDSASLPCHFDGAGNILLCVAAGQSSGRIARRFHQRPSNEIIHRIPASGTFSLVSAHARSFRVTAFYGFFALCNQFDGLFGKPYSRTSSSRKVATSVCHAGIVTPNVVVNLRPDNREFMGRCANVG